MHRKIIALLMIFALFPLASAFSEGQILTQQQVDNFDLSSYDTLNELVQLLECQKYDGFNFLWKNEWFYVKPFDCFQLDKLTSDTYIIKRKVYFPRFSINQYEYCLSVLDSNISIQDKEEICNEEATTQLREYGKGKIFKIKSEMESYQYHNATRTFNGTFGGDLW